MHQVLWWEFVGKKGKTRLFNVSLVNRRCWKNRPLTYLCILCISYWLGHCFDLLLCAIFIEDVPNFWVPSFTLSHLFGYQYCLWTFFYVFTLYYHIIVTLFMVTSDREHVSKRKPETNMFTLSAKLFDFDFQ